ncbi:hypothetical protein BG015_009020 [Linnemannia schmuckeri]|uniref:Uncharacterized protein n=1 Tax=Linnemannia schmuckeri TaxID=64567 RepID=A0A9P5RY95_9FUNG|nr:hypothetical protein BG015_009020 [Linnemannia schmuckeri]
MARPKALILIHERAEMNNSSETVVSDLDSVSDKDEWQHVLDAEDYNEEEAIRHAIQQSLHDHSRAPVLGEGDNNSSSNRGSASNTTQQALNSTKKSNSRATQSTQSASVKNGMGKIGGKRGQMLIDPWLSADVSGTDEEQNQPPPSNTTPRLFPNRRQLNENSRRTSLGRSRYENEPMVLLSTTSMTPLRDVTPATRFASPRQQPDVIEVIGSDYDEPEIEVTQVIRPPKSRRLSARHDRDKGKGVNKGKGVDRTVISPGSANRKRLIRASSVRSVNIISSSEDETRCIPSSPTRNRGVTIASTSDEEQDELLRDTGKNTLRFDTHRKRPPRHTISDDSIPISPSAQDVDVMSAQPESTNKMPWSIAEGPERDIVLSTPTSKQRTRHYNMVLDSEEEEASDDQDDPLIKWSERRRQRSASAKHLRLPKVDSIVTDNEEISALLDLVSGSENEQDILKPADKVPTEPPRHDDELAAAPQPTREEIDPEVDKVLATVMSQDCFDLSTADPAFHIVSDNPDDSTGIKLTKPRPLVLGQLSQPKESPQHVQEEHQKLRETLMFTDDIEECSPSPPPEPRRGRIAKNPFSNYAIFDQVKKKSPVGSDKKPPEDDMRLLQRAENTERCLGCDNVDDAEEDDEELEDPRARRRSGQHGLRSPSKKTRLSEIIPNKVVMESVLKQAAAHARQQERAARTTPNPPTRTETIESISFFSDSQPTQATQSSIARVKSQVDDLEEISDDAWTQQIAKDRHQRSSGLRVMGSLNLAPRTAPAAANIDNQPIKKAVDSPPSPPHPARHQDEEVVEEMLDGYMSPTLSQNMLEICPICQQKIPADEMMAHVDQELLAHDQQEEEARRRQDEALARELTETGEATRVWETIPSEDEADGWEIAPGQGAPQGWGASQAFRTQGDVVALDSLSGSGQLTQTPPKPHLDGYKRDVETSCNSRNDAVSLETPTRKVGHLSLESPASALKQSGQGYPRDDSFSDAFSGAAEDRSFIIEDDDISNTYDLSGMDSTSSQSAFYIQPGQKLRDDNSSEAYISMRPNARKTALGTSRTSAKKTGREKAPSSTVIPAGRPVMNEQSVGDDLDDFLFQPEPASMLNRSYRTKDKVADTSATGKSATGKSPSRRKSLTKPAGASSKKTTREPINLDDSGDDDIIVESKPVTKTLRGSKAKSSVLDNLLPDRVRRQRQERIKDARRRRSGGLAEEEDDGEIEIGRKQPVAEKFWNQEDDLFDSEQLDRRQVKGVGLGGVIGGIGAVAGSLNVSKITKNAAEVASTATESVSQRPTSTGLSKGKAVDRNGEHSYLDYDDNPFAGPCSFEYDDPNYGLNSQDLWDAVDPDRRMRNERAAEGEDGEEGEDDGEPHLSPLNDFVDLRKHQDNPEMAMYFAQFGMADGVDYPTGDRASGRGRGRGRSRGRGKNAAASAASRSPGKGSGVSFGPGIGRMSTTMGINGGAGQAVLTDLGVQFERAGPSGAHNDMFGAGGTPFGGYATTANGSMAIRSKPTVKRTTGTAKGGWKGRGGWRGWRKAGGGACGRGRGRGA